MKTDMNVPEKIKVYRYSQGRPRVEYINNPDHLAIQEKQKYFQRLVLGLVLAGVVISAWLTKGDEIAATSMNILNTVAGVAGVAGEGTQSVLTFMSNDTSIVSGTGFDDIAINASETGAFIPITAVEENFLTDIFNAAASEYTP